MQTKILNQRFSNKKAMVSVTGKHFNHTISQTDPTRGVILTKTTTKGLNLQEKVFLIYKLLMFESNKPPHTKWVLLRDTALYTHQKKICYIYV